MGRLFRRVVNFVEKHQLLDQVLARVSPETLHLITHRPGPMALISAAPFDELYAALDAIGGDALTFKLGMELSRRLGGSVAAPILRAAFAAFGRNLATGFKAANAAYSLVNQGISIQYQDLTPAYALLEVRFNRPLPGRGIMVVVQGSAQWMFELLDINGTVGPPQVRSQDANTTLVVYDITLRDPADAQLT